MFCMHAVSCLGCPVPEQIFCRPLPEPSGAWDACSASSTWGHHYMGGEPSRRCGFQPMRIGWCPVGHYMAPPSLLPGGDELLVATDFGPVRILFFGSPLRWAHFGKCAPTLNIF